MKKTTLTILLCTFLATAIFTLAACETQQSSDGTPTGTSASVEVTTAKSTTAESTEKTLGPAITAPQGVMTLPPYESVKLPEELNLNFENTQLVKRAVYCWEETQGESFPWLNYEETGLVGIKYCGTYNNVAVFFKGTDTEAHTEIKVGDVSYWYNYQFELIAFHDGEFCSLEDAYEQELLLENDLRSILRTHANVTSVLLSAEYSRLPTPEYVHPSKEATAEILEAYSELAGSETQEDDFLCIAAFDDTYALYLTALLYHQMMQTEWVGGYVFHYGSGMTLMIYHDGAFYEMQEAFDEGLLTEEQVAQLQKVYNRQHAEPNE